MSEKIILWESYKVSKFHLLFDILSYFVFFGVIIGVLSFAFDIGYARVWPIIFIFGAGFIITLLSFLKTIHNDLVCVVIKITPSTVEIYDKTGKNIQKIFDIFDIDKIEPVIKVGGRIILYF